MYICIRVDIKGVLSCGVGKNKGMIQAFDAAGGDLSWEPSEVQLMARVTRVWDSVSTLPLSSTASIAVPPPFTQPLCGLLREECGEEEEPLFGFPMR